MGDDPRTSRSNPARRRSTRRHQPILGVSQPCLECGYELKGLPFHVNCPECGTPVEHSLATITEADRSALHVRRALKFINAGWLAALTLIIGCCNLYAGLFICLIGSAFRCSGYLMIRRGTRGSMWSGVGTPGWQAVIAGVVTLGMLSSITLATLSWANPLVTTLADAYAITTLATLFLLCVEGAAWMFGVRAWAKHTDYPMLGPASSFACLGWLLPRLDTPHKTVSNLA